MKKFAKALLLISAMLMLVLGLSLTASAETEGYYTYEVSDGQATITEVDSYIGGEVSIPKTLGGYPVTAIGSQAFSWCRNIYNVNIPSSVTSIGDRAFFECINLVSINIPASVTAIGVEAFAFCDRLTSINVDKNNKKFSSSSDGVLFNKDKTSLICYPCGKINNTYQIPSSVTTIGVSAFYYCYNITTINIPESVTTIGDSAFKYCNYLSSVNILAPIITIGFNTFSDCYSLTSITIPSSVKSIESSVFYMCYSLTDVYYTGTKAQWNEINIINFNNESLSDATIHFNYIPAKHTYKIVTTKATLTKNGKVETKCSDCGDVSKTTTVYYPKTI